MEIAVFGMENRCFVMHEMEKVLLPTTTTDDGTGMKLRSSLSDSLLTETVDCVCLL